VDTCWRINSVHIPAFAEKHFVIRIYRPLYKIEALFTIGKCEKDLAYHHFVVKVSIEGKPMVAVIEGEIRMESRYFRTAIKY
jgi:hypothetical protein